MLSLGIYRCGLYALIDGGCVYRYEGEKEWAFCGHPMTSRQTYGSAIHTGNIDSTPVVGRRVWSMAVYEGKLFARTLPSGHIWSFEAGTLVSYDEVFPEGWHPITVIRRGVRLRVYLNGRLLKDSSSFSPSY